MTYAVQQLCLFKRFGPYGAYLPEQCLIDCPKLRLRRQPLRQRCRAVVGTRSIIGGPRLHFEWAPEREHTSLRGAR